MFYSFQKITNQLPVKIDTVYQELQSELYLDQYTVNYSRKLHDNLVQKPLFKFESPYLIAAICIFAVSCMEGTPKPLQKISVVSHIKEKALREFYQRVYGEIEESLKNL